VIKEARDGKENKEIEGKRWDKVRCRKGVVPSFEFHGTCSCKGLQAIFITNQPIVK